ncbi:response regulator transcription factor [Aquamicrobium sp. LC103]|uniref:response regulator transcription factor n=1 Tax=Aquamicrobium sp. LC103 TaxID=1120658 RepID=UPI00063E80B0|nr:response regulator transcription factor [Aquamicrobium sp. LC103]TKT78209.1 response regulator transcription factor [Aquamicrobium sp. LC103]
MTKILVVEDEPRLRKDLVDFLDLCGFSAHGVATARELREMLGNGHDPSIIVLDVGLPDANGFDLAVDIRKDHGCGIIMLTALGDSDDRIRGFNSGADIYLVKHSTLREIEAAIRSLLRRTNPPSSAVGSQPEGQWHLNRTTWVLTAPNLSSLKLTATEFAFINALCQRPGGVCDRLEISEAISRPKTNFDSKHLDAVVSRLRRKLEDRTKLPAPFKVVYGVGYTFTAPSQLA